MVKNSNQVLERLFETIKSRKSANPTSSYTASLFAAGMPEISKKVGEEAIEIITAGLSKSGSVASESADLLYHLLVLWAAADIKPSDVWSELEKREGVSGIDEKTSRK